MYRPIYVLLYEIVSILNFYKNRVFLGTFHDYVDLNSLVVYIFMLKQSLRYVTVVKILAFFKNRFHLILSFNEKLNVL